MNLIAVISSKLTNPSILTLLIIQNILELSRLLLNSQQEIISFTHRFSQQGKNQIKIETR